MDNRTRIEEDLNRALTSVLARAIDIKAGSDGLFDACQVMGRAALDVQFPDGMFKAKIIVTETAGDTNPDAAVAEAAQEAVEEPAHGQAGKTYVLGCEINCQALIDLRDQLYAMTKQQNAQHAAMAKEREMLMSRARSAHGPMADKLKAENVSLRQDVANLNELLDMGQTERDTLATNRDEWKHQVDVVQIARNAAFERLADMTAERDALKAKFDEAMSGLHNAAFYIKRDIETSRGNWSGGVLASCMSCTLELINADIAKLESK